MVNELGLPIDETLRIEMTIDKMFACIVFSEVKNDGKQLTKELINKAIEDKGITYGIDYEILEEIYRQRKSNYKYFIAKGQKPSTGADAYIEYAFDTENLNKSFPTLKEDGGVDLKDLNIIHNVEKGQKLAKKISAQEGEKGYNVLGQEVKAKMGKDIRIPKGRNTQILEDGLTLVASIGGQIGYDLHNIYISPTFFVKEDVDSSIGNINFVGNVVVNGAVRSGFTIKSGGNVEVRGYVEAAKIEAEGDIILQHGIQGSDKGNLRAKGNIIAKFIQNSEVSAGGDIITEAILHSRVSANKEIFVHKGKGTIVGGTILAGSRIIANTIGSTMTTVTNIQIGVSKDIVTSYQELQAKYLQLKEELDKVSKGITFLETKAKISPLPPDKQELLKKLLNTRTIFSSQVKEVDRAYREQEELIRNSNKGIIKVKDKVYPGVKVIMGNTTRYIIEEANYCTIRKIDGDIIIGLA